MFIRSEHAIEQEKKSKERAGKVMKNYIERCNNISPEERDDTYSLSSSSSITCTTEDPLNFNLLKTTPQNQSIASRVILRDTVISSEAPTLPRRDASQTLGVETIMMSYIIDEEPDDTHRVSSEIRQLSQGSHKSQDFDCVELMEMWDSGRSRIIRQINIYMKLRDEAVLHHDKIFSRWCDSEIVKLKKGIVDIDKANEMWNDCV
mmetsp:Transcript_11575/g.13187  ORF Transcript_11575/g.13187 Transcript_11575/m.13187 type:complete len:205 (+) Transcript_11575:62-676(+)